MDKTLERKYYIWMLAAYLAVGAGLAVYWIIKGNWYQFAQSLAATAMPGVYFMVYKLLRIRRAHRIDAIILLFTFLAYMLGVGARWYHLVPYYDKIMHTLSGALTMLLALAVFYLLKARKQIERTDCALALTFCLFASLAVAGLWEIVEYFINMFTGIDVQNAKSTGVADSMQDMIVCTIGALALVPPMLAGYRRDGAGWLMGAVGEFARNNPGLYARDE